MAIADGLVGTLQVEVSHEAWIGQDVNVKPSYDTARLQLAIVEDEQRQFRSASGDVIYSQCRIDFLRPLAANGADGRKEPIDPRDRLTLPDGTTGPILGISGLVDVGTGRRFYSQVWLGA